MKKKITIVTWIGCGNFGTSLQAFALHKKLEQLGYIVRILDGNTTGKTIKHYIKYILSKLGIYNIRTNKILKNESLSISKKKFKKFVSDNFNLIDNLNIPSQLSRVVYDTDVFVTGSDQIWNTRNFFDSFYFLDFAEETKRISYASSIGVEDFPTKDKPEIKRMLEKFAHLSLREETGVKAVSSLLRRNDVVQVLDPTLLLDKEEWIHIIEKAKIEIELPKKYIFCYLLGRNDWYIEQLQKVKDATGIFDVIIVPAIENPNFVIENAKIYDAAGPLEFVKLIWNSVFVCTDSFHATALSINMGKNFVEFMRFKDSDIFSQNSRIYDLLGRYSLMYKIYSNEHTDWMNEIPYNEVNNLLLRDRSMSLNFLVESIEN